MHEIADFFQKLLDVSDWPPRWLCGKWSDFHGWFYILSDLTIWLAYFAIPVVLVWFIQRNRNIPFLPVFWLFVSFILLCGATHAIDAIIFWWPAYRLSALLRFFTAVVSVFTVFAMIRDLPKALDLPGADKKKKDSTEVEELRLNYQATLDRLYEREKEIQRLKTHLRAKD